ncbi:MAG: hypothetical protein RLZZ118_2093 [Bacteroidota bacterium]
MATVLLITPPFTQLNTPYPATAYLKGFLYTKNISSYQADLGIEVLLKLFSKNGFKEIFDSVTQIENYSANAQRMYQLKDWYLQTIDETILFLQSQNATLTHHIASRNYLPEASRFAQLQEADMLHAFGTMGNADKAKHFATLYLEDMSDFIQECIDPHFGFSRYAERLGRSANSFDELQEALHQPFTLVDRKLIDCLSLKLEEQQPALVCISVPFPGNLFAAFRCAQYIKTYYPLIKVAMGGGFANTELRSISDPSVFAYFDFITLDDGEAPVENLVYFVEGKIKQNDLKRTFLLENNQVIYINNKTVKDYKQGEIGTPSYEDLWLHQYINAIEIVNPMHSLWSNGRWNKLTMAHGCYWGKCTFCDISLDYIKIYEPITAQLICDRMQEQIKQTGVTGFHFVDEAAPPALMRAVALEIIKRKLTVTWWTNVRFEKSFTRDLCILLKESGCIGVSGGLEVASDRLLKLIDKGITVAQVAKVNKHFTQAGIMVHAYLMYGFPTQTAQETIDSLEMVRQLFETGVLQSAFWHQFVMTAHSPVGLAPEKFGVSIPNPTLGAFANNDIVHQDDKGAHHELFSDGLKKSLFNYMNAIGFDWPLQKWFTHKVPNTTIAKNYIQDIILQEEDIAFKPNAKVIFIGAMPTIVYFTKSKKGKEWQMASVIFSTKKETIEVKLGKVQADWIMLLLPKISIYNALQLSMQQVKESYETETGLDDFELFWFNNPMHQVSKVGVLVI